MDWAAGIKTLYLATMLLLSFPLPARECAQDTTSFRNLFKDKNLPLSWTETTADDGKPLNVVITENSGTLFLEFVKTKEGLWASGTADICLDNGEVVASIKKEHIKLGDAAPWVLRMSMKGGTKFTLKLIKPELLKISTFGWKGEFVPK